MRFTLALLVAVWQATPSLSQQSLSPRHSCLENVLNILCLEQPRMEGSSRKADAEARAEAKVTGMLRWVFGADASISGSAVAEEYANVLREDIPDVRRMATECRERMLSVVWRDICQIPQGAAAAVSNPPVYREPSSEALGGGIVDPRSRRGVDLFQSGRFSEASQLGEEIAATATDPEARSEGHILAGAALMRLAEQRKDVFLAEKAIVHFDSAETTGWQLPPQDQVDILSRKAWANIALGQLHSDTLYFSKAEYLSRIALNLLPQSPDARAALGAALAMKGSLLQQYSQIREGIGLLRLSQAEFAESGDAESAQYVENWIHDICQRGMC